MNMCFQEESNLCQGIRNPLFYPLNYGSMQIYEEYLNESNILHTFLQSQLSLESFEPLESILKILCLYLKLDYLLCVKRRSGLGFLKLKPLVLQRRCCSKDVRGQLQLCFFHLSVQILLGDLL